MNQLLPKRLLYSIGKFFTEICDPLGYETLVEGIDMRDASLMTVDRVEIRMNGPFVKEVSANYERIRVMINIVFTVYINDSTNMYKLYEDAGVVMANMVGRIPIYKLTSEGGDLIGCLSYKPTRDTDIKMWHFGMVSKEDNMKQVMLDGEYEIYLEGN